MYEGKMVFSQVMDHAPQHLFRKCVKRYGSNRHVKSFPCWSQFLCMAFAQLSYRASLRDIEISLRAHGCKLYHMGIHGQVCEGKFKTPEGRKILVSENTPFCGFVVCDLTTKVERWLEFEKDYKLMPDKLGWFRWHDNINLYLEVVSWDKVLRDAEMRNRYFSTS